MKTSHTPGITTQAFQWLRVQVEEIDATGVAQCFDQYGRHYGISITLRRIGRRPQPGEFWLIDRAIGGIWTFAAQLVREEPEEADDLAVLYWMG